MFIQELEQSLPSPAYELVIQRDPSRSNGPRLDNHPKGRHGPQASTFLESAAAKPGRCVTEPILHEAALGLANPGAREEDRNGTQQFSDYTQRFGHSRIKRHIQSQMAIEFLLSFSVKYLNSLTL